MGFLTGASPKVLAAWARISGFSSLRSRRRAAVAYWSFCLRASMPRPQMECRRAMGVLSSKSSSSLSSRGRRRFSGGRSRNLLRRCNSEKKEGKASGLAARANCARRRTRWSG